MAVTVCVEFSPTVPETTHRAHLPCPNEHAITTLQAQTGTRRRGGNSGVSPSDAQSSPLATLAPLVHVSCTTTRASSGSAGFSSRQM